MRRLLLSLLVVATAAGSALTGGARADTNGGTLIQQCFASLSSSVDDPGYKFCRSAEGIAWIAAAQCRLAARETSNFPDSVCTELDGRAIDEQQVADYEHSWVHQALTLQRGLDAEAPLWEEQIPHTHNSFNASAYYLPTDGSAPSYYDTLTNQDPNQVYSLTDQLRMDIRAIEIDLHWVPSPYGNASTAGYWPTMCHGDGEDPTGQGLYAHVGCTDDRPMQDGLAEVRRWLDANPGQFVVIYLENQLYGSPVASQQLAHDTAAGVIEQQLGSLVYRPPAGLAAGQCATMPYQVSRASMLAAHKQVLLVGNCGPGSSWNQWVFTRGSQWDESGDPTNYSAPDCAKDEAAREQDASFRRYFEEQTWLEAMSAGTGQGQTSLISPATTAAMVRCGVNIIGLDQLLPSDPRLAALVWSWAPGQPAGAGDCALRGADGRFSTAACVQRHPVACVDGTGDWHATTAAATFAKAAALCRKEFPGSSFGVPPNGYRDGQLGRAVAWVDYARVHGQWTPR
jgi:hypothetical protein